MAFKVFDLQCEHGHVFEGWFSSHADFDTQREQGLIGCPLCDSKTIEKKLSAPMLNVSGAKAPFQPASAGETGAGQPAIANIQAAALQHLRQLVRQTENVGERFAQEARRIHHGEAPERAIRGTASAEERASLAEEGIPVAPIPDFLDDERMQ